MMNKGRKELTIEELETVNGGGGTMHTGECADAMAEGGSNEHIIRMWKNAWNNIVDFFSNL